MFDLPSFPLAASGGVRLPWSEMTGLRAHPGSFQGRDLANLVRQSDELTLTAIAAMNRSIEDAGWSDRSFANWGVVASARSFGRVRFDTLLGRFRKMGAQARLPVAVPHLSLHAIASTLSVAFGVNGPSFGVSGRDSQVGEALLAGIGLIEREDVEGVWIVLADFDPEPRFDDGGIAADDVTAQAVALAVCRDSGAMELTLKPGKAAESSVSDLIEWLQGPYGYPWCVGIPGVGSMEISRRTALRRAS